MFSQLQNTQSGECLIVGNGPSMQYIPDWFLATRPTFAFNKFYKASGFLPSYYVFYEGNGCVENFRHVSRGQRFVHENIRSLMPDDIEDAVWFADTTPRVGFEFRVPENTELPLNGTIYRSSAHIGAWLASYLGYTTVLLIGIDCTKGHDGLTKQERIEQDVDSEGRKLPPHFYGPKQTQIATRVKWNEDWKLMYAQLNQVGVKLINLSPETHCTTIPKDDWRNYA